MLRRLSVSVLAAIAVAPASVAVLEGYAIAQPAPTLPSATTVLPADTPGLLLVNTDAAAWGQLNRFNPLADDPFIASLPMLIPSEFSSLAADVQSWLGDRVAIALLPTASDKDTIGSSAVLLAPSTNPEKLTAFVEKLKGMQAPDSQQTYNGVTILQWQPPKPEEPACEEQTPEDTGSQSSLLKLLAPQLSFLPRMGQAMRCQVNALSLVAAPTPLPSDESQMESEPESESESEPEEPSGARMPGLSTGIAIAQLPGHLAVASEPAALQKLIDAQARTPLAQNPQFQRTLKHAQFERSLTVGYGEYTGLLKLANQFFAQLPPIPDPEGKNVRPQKLFSAKQIDYLTQNYSTFDLLTWVRPEGLHSQSNAYFTGLKPEKATPNFPDANQILTRLPAATFVSANSRNFKQQWQEFVEFSQGDKESEDALKLIRDSVRKTTGLDLDQDLIAWMDQQYAVFFFPTKGGFFNAINPQINIGYALLIQTSDRPAAEAALKKIDQLVKKEAGGGISIANRRIKGQPMTSWEAKDGKRSVSLLSHHWISNDTLMLTSGTGAAADLTPKPFVPLNLTYTFKTATNPFPLPSQGYFYLNMGSTLAFVNTLVRAFEPEIVESPYYQTGLSIIGTIRSISSSQTMTDDRLQADSLWVLGARRQASTVSQPEPSEPSNSSDQTP